METRSWKSLADALAFLSPAMLLVALLATAVAFLYRGVC